MGRIPQGASGQGNLQGFRTPGVGEQLVLRENAFVEKILPGSIRRKLSEEEMATYRRPFPDERSRIPTLRFPNELPKESTYPKVLFGGNPGALVSPAFGRAFASGLIDCEFVEIGDGARYLQEDHPDAIAEGVVKLIARAETMREESVPA